MSKVQAISGATGEEIGKLTEKAKEMGAKTKFSATESAAAFQYMAMAGWKTEDMLNGIEGIMNLAAASGEDLASVSDIVTDALTAFGLQAKDSAHFADVLAKASSNSNTNVGLMGETFKYVAPLAGSMKYSVEDTAVAIGLMANAGIKGSQAGTALRSMLTRLVKPPKQAAAALDALKISAKNSDGTMKPLAQTMKELRVKFANLSESQKASYAASIAGQEAMSGMLAIVNASDEDFNKLTKSINNADGASKEMADTMNDNLKGSITLLKSNLESLGIRIYEKIKEPLKKIVNTINKYISEIPIILKNIYNWTNKNKELIKTTIKVVASLTAGYLAYKATLIAINAIQLAKNIIGTVSAFLSLIPTIRSAKDAMLLLNMAFSVNPIALVVAGVVALTTALVAFSLKQTDAQKEAKKFADEMANSRQKMLEYNESIDKTTNAELAQINSVGRLRDELKQLVDENGKIKQGYESRVDFILNELNSALGTEYTRTGDIINKYKELQGEIDEIIRKKKAQIILEGNEEKYRNAIKEEEKALNDLKSAMGKLNEIKEKYGMTLDQLREKAQNGIGKEKEEIENVLKGYDEATQTVKENYEIQKGYTDNYSLYIQGKYDEIGKSITGSTSQWTDGTLNTLVEGIKKQSKELEEWKSTYEVAGTELSKTQKENAEKNLVELAQNLHDRTKTVGELGRDEYIAWKSLAEGNYRVYSEQLGKMHPDLKRKIENLTGYLQGDTSLPDGMEMLVKKTTSTYEEKMKFLLSATDNKLTDIESELRNNTSIQNEAGMIVMRAGNEIEKDTTVSRASKMLADNANKQFNNNVDGKKWGIDLSENISTGMTSQKSQNRITESAKSIAGWIKSIIGHSVPKEGPLKDELTYMPDMIDNLVKGIEKNKYKVVNTTSQLADDIKNSFELEELNKEIIRKMQNAVALETGSINAKASIKSNNSMINVIQASFNVDGSVNIDGQKAGRIITPYMTKTLRTGGAYR